MEAESAAVTLVAMISPASAEMVTSSAETTLVAKTPSLVVLREIASAVDPSDRTSVAVINPSAPTTIGPSLVSTSTSSTEPLDVTPIPPEVVLERSSLDPSATSKYFSVNPVESTPISSCAVKVISPPAVKSTAESSDASLIEPALEVRVTSFPTLKEPISRSFLSMMVTSDSVSVANTVTAPPKSLFAPSRLTSASVPEVTSSEVVPITVIPSVAS